MSTSGCFNPEQLVELTNILDEYCLQANIAGAHSAREQLARRLIVLFQGGIVKPDDIKKVLDSLPPDMHV